MLAQSAAGYAVAPGLGNGFGDLIGMVRLYEPDEFARQHARDRPPFSGDDRYVMREGLDQDEGLAFVLIIGGKTDHIALSEEFSLGGWIGKTDKMDGGA